MAPKKDITTVTLTCEEASRRHQGVTSVQMARLCLRGKALAKRYGGASRVPAKEQQSAMFARKVGKSWQIPIAELDRVFLP